MCFLAVVLLNLAFYILSTVSVSSWVRGCPGAWVLEWGSPFGGLSISQQQEKKLSHHSFELLNFRIEDKNPVLIKASTLWYFVMIAPENQHGTYQMAILQTFAEVYFRGNDVSLHSHGICLFPVECTRLASLVFVQGHFRNMKTSWRGLRCKISNLALFLPWPSVSKSWWPLISLHQISISWD